MSYRPIVDYLLHRPPMVLLDRVIEAAESHIVCEAAIQVDSPFCDGAAVPGWVGIEYMAQTIGVLAGWRALAKQLPVRIGFLVGTRHYQSHAPQFPVGEVLRVTADEELMADGGLVAMRCTIHAVAGVLLAEASLLVFQPDDLDAYLQQTLSARENTSG
ncbi:MAG: 3-hydroxylacyl-ACP dehydratase [Burkholderiales bacterium]|jgi:predicted hotdog family 3-hydroxylacyl-ACP dehydratase|nr:3-hydroxylacyl-ACP dehydratase [Burkholderiales bacterium]